MARCSIAHVICLVTHNYTNNKTIFSFITPSHNELAHVCKTFKFRDGLPIYMVPQIQRSGLTPYYPSFYRYLPAHSRKTFKRLSLLARRLFCARAGKGDTSCMQQDVSLCASLRILAYKQKGHIITQLQCTYRSSGRLILRHLFLQPFIQYVVLGFTLKVESAQAWEEYGHDRKC